jgi:predicted dehydrogenase
MLRVMKRRDLLAAGAVAPWFAPASVFGANDRLTFGAIGTGNRGGWLHRTFQKLGAQCVAVCDVYQPYLDRAVKESPPGVKAYVDYREMLEQRGIDFVVIGTPDHQHKPMLLAALAARKDVYLEKPFSMSLEESREMAAAVRRTDRIVQIGMQRRSMPFIHNAKKVIDDGALGKISLARAAWNWHFDAPLDNSPLEGKLDWDRFLGPAPKRPMEPKRFRWWRGFYDYSGGNMTDQGTHLMDVVQWMTNNGAPKSAVCHGYICKAKNGEVPDVFTAVFEYPDMMATWTLNYCSAFDFDWSITLQGERATMVMDRRGYRIYKDPGGHPRPGQSGPATEIIAEVADKDSAELHPKNFLDCVRSRREPNCPVEVAAAAVAGPHMANLAMREGRRVTA